MPAGEILSVGLALAGTADRPRISVAVDEHAPDVTRRFAVLRVGDFVPAGACYVGTWSRHLADGGLAFLYELIEADVPADLPAEVHEHYRVLIADGFTLRSDKAWIAPADVPLGHLTHEQIVAVVSLQEHGYGAVVGA